MTSRNDLARIAAKLQRQAEEIMAVIRDTPPDTQAKLVRPTARLIDIMTRIDMVMAELGAKSV